MKKCIWCTGTESTNTFNTLAHTIPQSVGGKNICENVCDECNFYFGRHHGGMQPIDTVLKETFNLSRVMIAATFGDVGRNKPIPRFTSVFFKLDFKKRIIQAHRKFDVRPSFQENLGRQLKRGLYKIFLEESERQHGTGHDDKYSFVRRFVRFNEGNLPVFYFNRHVGIMFLSKDDIKNPVLFIDEKASNQYLINHQKFFEFEINGHVFSIATAEDWLGSFEHYMNQSLSAKSNFFNGYREVLKFTDVDFSFEVMDDWLRPKSIPVIA